MKIKILFTGVFITALMFIFMNAANLSLCEYSNFECLATFDKLEVLFYIAPIFTLFALTSFHSDIIFSSWWKFSRVAGPLILVISIFILMSPHNSNGGFVNIDNDIDILAIFFLYGLFIFGSLIQILRGYLSK